MLQSTLLSWLKAAFAWALLILVSYSSLQPKYLKCSTWFNVLPSTRILQTGATAFFDTTMTSVFLMLICMPNFLLTQSNCVTKALGFLAIKTVSSAYLKLLTLTPRTPIRGRFLMVLMKISLNKDYKSGDNTQPCLKPLLIGTILFTVSLILTVSVQICLSTGSNCLCCPNHGKVNLMHCEYTILFIVLFKFLFIHLNCVSFQYCCSDIKFE